MRACVSRTWVCACVCACVCCRTADVANPEAQGIVGVKEVADAVLHSIIKEVTGFSGE